MKTVLYFSFALLVFLQSMGSSLILLDYEMNKSYFISSCENRMTPSLHCNGKCKVVKEIKKAEKNQNKMAGNWIEKNEVLFMGHLQNVQFISMENNFIFFGRNILVLLNGELRQIFHPPLC